MSSPLGPSLLSAYLKGALAGRSRAQCVGRLRTERALRDSHSPRQMSESVLPLFVSGEVTRGFGRGSKELGCPTANYSQDVVKSLPQELETGVYCGWASVDRGPAHKMVMSVGWNPFYNGKEKTMEIHILHNFDGQFYGAHMRTCVLKYLRPELNFNSVEELIAHIEADIAKAKVELDDPALSSYQTHSYFTNS